MSLSFLLAANHLQITYYTLLTLLIFGIGFLVQCVREKDFQHLWRSISLAMLAGALGISTNAVNLLTTYEYSKRTIRGGSQLADAKTAVTQTGLSKDYALSYSVYKTEPLVMMFPRLYGGSSFGLEVAETDSKAIAALQQMPQELAQQIQGALRFYWGGIDGVGTSGPPYVGAVICFLALMGLAWVDKKHTGWMLAAIVLTLFMSWGKYFEAFNVGLLKFLPFYAKFRAPSMILVIPTFLLCCLAALSLEKVFASPDKSLLWETFKKKAWWPVAGVFAAALLLYFSADFSNDTDKMLLQNVAAITDPAQKATIEAPVRAFVAGLQEDRKSLFWGDLVRSLLFCSLAAGVLYAALKTKINPIGLVAGLGVLVLVDVFGINANYLSSKNFIDAEENNQAFVPSAADTQILRDTGYYRVLNLTQGIEGAFNAGAITAYFHRSVGGYHPAKLSLYQDLIEKQLYKFPNCLPVLNMLNTKYLILPNPQTNQPTVQENTNALGAAWLVKGIRTAQGPSAVMQALDQFNPADTAIVDAALAARIQFKGGRDSLANINLVYNHNDEIVYQSSAAAPQFAVFSEVYYDAGWTATIDGKEAKILPVNYVLRGLDLPAGNHRIVFRFEPRSYQLGNKAAMASSALIWLLLLGALFSSWRQKKQA
ncbi:MAG: hypothetical protein EAZ62_03305 [Sphingobacteriia bacterium]|nr:MAG: hypothetical protein EAZ62_03305 [Sphingobacteriia bacterium]